MFVFTVSDRLATNSECRWGGVELVGAGKERG